MSSIVLRNLDASRHTLALVLESLQGRIGLLDDVGGVNAVLQPPRFMRSSCYRRPLRAASINPWLVGGSALVAGRDSLYASMG